MNAYRSIVLILLFGQAAISQTSRFPAQESESIRRTLQFSGSSGRVIELDNLRGSIHVTPAAGASVEMIAEKTIQAESDERLDAAKRDIRIDIADNSETIRIYVDGPFRCRCADDGDGWRSFGSRWNNPGYRVAVDFDLKVPAGTKMRLRTVNAGDIVVDGTTGDFELENVNGRISMTDIRGSGNARTVNGSVKATFRENPQSSSSFKTTNGVIEVAFQPGLSADLQMRTRNGGLYTDFDVAALPASPVVSERVGGVYRYKGNSFSGFRVGNGGPEIKFDGFNGDVRILSRTR